MAPEEEEEDEEEEEVGAEVALAAAAAVAAVAATASSEEAGRTYSRRIQTRKMIMGMPVIKKQECVHCHCD